MITDLILHVNNDKILIRINELDNTNFMLSLNTSWNFPHIIFEDLKSSKIYYYSSIQLDDHFEIT